MHLYAHDKKLATVYAIAKEPIKVPITNLNYHIESHQLQDGRKFSEVTSFMELFLE